MPKYIILCLLLSLFVTTSFARASQPLDEDRGCELSLTLTEINNPRQILTWYPDLASDLVSAFDKVQTNLAWRNGFSGLGHRALRQGMPVKMNGLPVLQPNSRVTITSMGFTLGDDGNNYYDRSVDTFTLVPARSSLDDSRPAKPTLIAELNAGDEIE